MIQPQAGGAWFSCARKKAGLAPTWVAGVAREGTNTTAPTEVIGCILDTGEDAKTEILGSMNEDQKRALRLALNHALGDTTEVSQEDRELVLRLLGKREWPPAGFRALAYEIVFQAIAHEGAFSDLW